jgi:hypothetical protein
METWVKQIIKILEKTKAKSASDKAAIENALHVFKYGKGWLTNDMPSKIFFWSDFHDRNAVE